jgi:branched-chain amino acid transport system ATP-binding protein
MPIIRRVADEHDAGVVMVEQHVHLALEVADDALVLVHGNVVTSGPAELFRHDTSVIEEAYLTGRIATAPAV